LPASLGPPENAGNRHPRSGRAGVPGLALLGIGLWACRPASHGGNYAGWHCFRSEP